MKVNSYNAAQANNYNAQPSFGKAAHLKSDAQKAFNWIGDKCNIHNGSLTREMFFAVSAIFLVGARFVGARDKDERREILTRDVPAVAVSGFGALLLNNAVARAVTKKTGIPITFSDKNKLHFATQKQVKDWYSGLSTVPNPLVSFVETVERCGGNIQKVMNKFGFTKELEAVSKAADNKGIISEIKKAKANKALAFNVLEDLIKNVPENNKVLKFAKWTQASVKLGCLGLTAAFLGYFLPRLNIIITKKKCKEDAENVQLQTQNDNMSKNDVNVMKVSSYHSNTARQSFKNFLNMFNK